jgi:hypothetical protein
LEEVRNCLDEVVTADEITREKEEAKTNRVETNHPGQLVGEDTFYIGYIKGIGKIYYQVASCCFSFFGAAKVHNNKTTETSTYFVENHLIKKFASVRIDRIFKRWWNGIYHLA